MLPLLLDNRVSSFRLPRKKLTICLNHVLKKKKSQRVEVVFVSAKTMKQLNRDFHKCNEVTDVLAFPYGDGFLGEVFVCIDVAKKQAKLRGLSVTSELILYAVHGCLHLMGYDDHDSKNAKLMRVQEVKALAQAGLKTDRLELA